MSASLRIEYRDFYDVPRMFVTRFNNKLYLFDCEFDMAADDYSAKYKIYSLPELSEDELRGDWRLLPQRATRLIGEVSVTEVRFDETKRKEIDAGVLKSLVANPG